MFLVGVVGDVFCGNGDGVGDRGWVVGVWGGVVVLWVEGDIGGVFGVKGYEVVEGVLDVGRLNGMFL